MVASAVAGEGKTLTALNLALTLSESYRRQVVLIDADLRRPRVHELLDISGVAGLNEALKGPGRSTLALVEVSPRLSVLPAGLPDPDPMGALTSRRMAEILDEAAARFDWVIVDTPPVVLLPDTNLLASMVDAAVLVIEAGRTSYDVITVPFKHSDERKCWVSFSTVSKIPWMPMLLRWLLKILSQQALLATHCTDCASTGATEEFESRMGLRE